MSATQTSGDLRNQIEPLPPNINPDLPEPHDVPQERMVQTPPGSQGEVLLAIPTSPTTQSPNNQPSITLIQFVSLPLDPPSYSDLPVYAIPVPNGNNPAIFDPPPPYDPSMRQEGLNPHNYQQNRSSRFECNSDTLVPPGRVISDPEGPEDYQQNRPSGFHCNSDTLVSLGLSLAFLGVLFYLGSGVEQNREET